MARIVEEISGEFEFERNVFNSGEDRTIIGELADGTTIKGRASEGSLEHGLTYRFYGNWTNHPKYGKQFAFQSFTLATPSGQRGTVSYLQRGPGIGRKRALQIWDAFGSESLEVLRYMPDKVANAIGGMPLEKWVSAAEYFQKLAGVEAVTIELTELLGGRGFPRTLITAVMEKWGNAAPDFIRGNPYILMQFKGAGFLRTDALYLELGHPADSVERQAYCIWHALHSDTEGHTWLPLDRCVKHLERNIAGGTVDAEKAVEWALGENLIVVHGANGDRWLAAFERAAAEMKIADCVHQAEVE